MDGVQQFNKAQWVQRKPGLSPSASQFILKKCFLGTEPSSLFSYTLFIASGHRLLIMSSSQEMDAQEQKECDASESGSLPAPSEHLHGLRLWIVGFGLESFIL